MSLFRNKNLSKLNRDSIIILAFIILAGISRLIFLDSIPPGINGDEGWTGIDTWRILHEGWIGSYVGSALGQPIGLLYLSTAPIFKMFGDSIFWLRFSMAFFGIITIPLFYFFMRQSFSKAVSFLTTLALCFSLYHLHYSRIAFMLIAAPFFQLFSYWFLFQWRKNKSSSCLIICALATGLGLYTYNSFVLFPITIFGFLTYALVKEKFNKKILIQVSLFTIIFLSISSFLLKIIIFEPDFYFQHYNSVSSVENFSNTIPTINKIYAISIEGLNEIYRFFNGHHIDFTDGFGKWITFNHSLLSLALIGIFYMIRHPNEKSVFLFISLLTFLTPIFLTVDYGIYRREILSIVPIFYFMGLGIVYTKKLLSRFKNLIPLFMLIIAIESIVNLYFYFHAFTKDAETKYSFTYDLTETSLALKTTMNEDSRILFFSNRWSCQYETPRFLFNTNNCEDRSDEFGFYNIDTPHYSNVIYVLLGNYLDSFSDIEKKYYWGKKYEIKDKDTKETIGIIYKL